MLLAGIATFAQLYAPQAVLPEISDAFGVTIAQSSLMVSMGTLGLAVATVPWSLVADRIGRKLTISWAICAATVFGIAVVLMPTFELALLMRILEGAALGGVPAVAMAYINEEIHRIDAAAAVGTFIAGNTFGGLLGRVVAGPVGEAIHWRAGVLAVSMMAILAVAAFIVLMPRPQGFIPPRGHQASLRNAISTTLANAGQHLKDPVLRAIYLQPFLLMGGFVAIYNYLGYRLTGSTFGLPVWISSFVFVAYLAGTISSPWAGRIAGMRGRKVVTLWCDLGSIVGLLIMLVPNLAVLIGGLILFTGAFFGSHAVASGWAASHPKTGRAQSTALYNLFYYVGSSVFGFVGGLFFQSLGWPALIGMVVALFLIGGIVALVVLPRRRKPAPAA